MADLTYSFLQKVMRRRQARLRWSAESGYVLGGWSAESGYVLGGWSAESGYVLDKDIGQLRAEYDYGSVEGGTHDPEKELCVICLARPSLFQFTPCGHQVVCEPCGLGWMLKHTSCVVCRRESEGIERVYRRDRRRVDDIMVVAQEQRQHLPPAGPEQGADAGVVVPKHGDAGARGSSPREVCTAVDVSSRAQQGTPLFLLVEFKLDAEPRDINAAKHYLANKDQFFESQKAIDGHLHEHDQKEVFELFLPSDDDSTEKLKKRLLLCRDGTGKPWWVRRTVYYVFLLFGLDSLFRKLLFGSARREVWWVTKLFGIGAPGPRRG